MNKILVIDDEQPTLSMFRLVLGAYGYEVLTAESGEEGLEVFSAERPAIVLTDIKMPGMDGLDVLKRLKEINPQTEVIVITGHGDMDIAIKALNLNATDFINKPIQRNCLEAALSRANERLKLSESKQEEVASEQNDGVTVIRVQGNITAQSEPFFISEYEHAEENGNPVVLYFDENSSINGAGIAVMVQLLSESQDRGVDVAIAGLSENFRKVFDAVGITRFATIYDSIEEATHALQAG
ncbi:response regulator [Desulfobaculum bizertense]|uniref:Anti-anti-sigma factor n=1 Tax=Desulfobaculum bizertense DSM 18034 TaxID=1121442 RepID=A0A1T4WNX6_9BACT|nr:response regulator [Desulfobaculum bizertense]UIJ39335.1 response regulator [Desulfobaculum bizertense]SKA78817.1 anti-anti-sigma factor [Desulfobaculum bizertense DSM 18034]